METRTLGKDFTVSAIGLGCMGFSHAYGAPAGHDEAVAAIRQAVEIGCTMFDTAEVYGTADDPHQRLLAEQARCSAEEKPDVPNGERPALHTGHAGRKRLFFRRGVPFGVRLPFLSSKQTVNAWSAQTSDTVASR